MLHTLRSNACLEVALDAQRAERSSRVGIGRGSASNSPVSWASTTAWTRSRRLSFWRMCVQTHITHIRQQLNPRDRVPAVVLAHETGLFEADPRPIPTRDDRSAR